MLLSYTHHEKTRSGKPYFIIRTRNPINRSMFGVPFRDGVGRTTDPERARMFDQHFGYEVQGGEGFKGWEGFEGLEAVSRRRRARKADVSVEEFDEAEEFAEIHGE